MRFVISCVLFSALACASFGPAAASARTIQTSDLRSIVNPSQVAISPDGKRVVVVATAIDWSKDQYKKSLELFDLASHDRRTLTYERDHLGDPAWSPDGTRLAFIADAGEGDHRKPQVYVMPMAGGDARPITSAPDGVDHFEWSHAGDRIAYVATEAKPDRKGADKYRDAFVFTTEPITALEVPRPAHLFVVSASGGPAKALTRGPKSVSDAGLSWSKDDKRIAFVLMPDAILNDDVAGHVDVVDVATGQLSNPTPYSTYEGSPNFSPDGTKLAFDHVDGNSQIFADDVLVGDSAGGAARDVTKAFDRTSQGYVWSNDSRAIYYVANDGTKRDLVDAPLDGTPHAIDLGDVQITQLAPPASDGGIVFIAASARSPQEIYYLAPGAKAPVRVSDFNASTRALDLADSRNVEYKSDMGVTADAVLITPPGFSPARRYPLALLIHGGPTSASVRGFDALGQLMAARGWLVLEPNYRGSDDLGLAFQRGVLYDPEAGPGRDIMAAVGAVEAMGIVDPHRIAVSGWSYGGIMTAWMISKYHVWRAAVSGASVNDWAADYGVADDSGDDAALFHGSPYLAKYAGEWRKASSIEYVADVTTPTLILSDVGDNRDPFATSSMYYRALRDNRKDVTFVAYPVSGHFPSDPVRILDVYDRWAGYIAQHFR